MVALKDRLSRKLRVRDFNMLEAVFSRGSMARAAEELGRSSIGYRVMLPSSRA